MSVNSDTNFLDHTEFCLYDVEAELVSEICSYLEIHDQVNMRRVCKWWKTSLSETFLSRLVGIDGVGTLNQSDDYLENMLRTHVKKNSRILIMRHICLTPGRVDIIARVIRQKDARLIQLTLKDCEVKLEVASSACWWIYPERITSNQMLGLTFVTKKLVLENYTMLDSLNCALNLFNPDMPCNIARVDRRASALLLQVVLPRYEFDCTKPLQQQYNSFIMALNTNCPEVCPAIRDEVVNLYNSWIDCSAKQRQWLSVGNLVKSLHEGIPVSKVSLEVNVPALRKLDPRTLNKLAIHALHRLYF